MNYMMISEIKAEIKLFKFIYLFDLYFLAVWFFLGFFVLKNLVYESFEIPFLIIHCIFGLILRAESPYNQGKRVYQGLMLFFKKDSSVYKPIQIVTTQKIEGYEKMYGEYKV